MTERKRAVLTLPFPPSVNTYYRSPGGSRAVLISKKGRIYRTNVLAASWGCPTFGEARLEVNIDLYPPDQRKRDLDNYVKAMWDAMKHAGIFADDSQIDEFSVKRCAVTPKFGEAVVEILEILPKTDE